jgi:hypothetical protein
VKSAKLLKQKCEVTTKATGLQSNTPLDLDLFNTITLNVIKFMSPFGRAANIRKYEKEVDDSTIPGFDLHDNANWFDQNRFTQSNLFVPIISRHQNNDTTTLVNSSHKIMIATPFKHNGKFLICPAGSW